MRTILTAEQRKIKNWMKANVEDNLQPNSPWEVNTTALAENCAWFSGLVDAKVLDNEAWIGWDLAVDVAEWYEELAYEEMAS